MVRESEYVHFNEDMDETSNVIDFVLVYKFSNLSNDQQLKLLMYEKSLLQTGLTLRLERYKNLSFLKITLHRPVLFQYAELLRLRMPLKWDDDVMKCSSQHTEDFILKRFFSFLSINKEEKQYKICAEFSRNKLYLFNESDPDFFNTLARITIAAYIIERASYGAVESFGIEPLIMDKVFLDAYPLHDGTVETKDSLRYKLLKNWASMRCWYKHQPLNEIRDYFGSTVALYFVWLGFYNKMLVPASIGGVITTLFGILVAYNDGFSKDVCSHNITMCPLCDKYCPYWNLRTSCEFVKWSNLSDNIFTITFCILMSVWNIVYLVMWNRHMTFVTYNWGLSNHHIAAEPTRPEYLLRLRKVKKRKLNVLTLTPEPYVSFWMVKFPIYIFTCLIILLWIALAVVVYVTLMVYQMGKRSPQFYITIMITIIHISLIYPLNFMYSKCASWLTDIELHRTSTQHENSFCLKLYVFQFVTHYMPVFYLAFVKGRFMGYPGNYVRMFGVRRKDCIGTGCLWEVMQFIAITMTVKQALYLIAARYLPVIFIYKWKLVGIIKSIFRGNDFRHYNQVVDDYKLLKRKSRDLHLAYLDMVLQFGFVSMFVNAFPVAHSFALLFNTMRIRVDAISVVKYYKRPVPKIDKDIGVWVRIIYIITRISIFTNAATIALSPRFIPNLVFFYEGLTTRFGSGFLKHALSKFDTRDLEKGTEPEPHLLEKYGNPDYCYYFGFREPPESEEKYTYTLFEWKVIAVKLAFLIAYYIMANIFIYIVEWSIPAVPTKVAEKIEMENYHISKAILKQENKNK